MDRQGLKSEAKKCIHTPLQWILTVLEMRTNGCLQPRRNPVEPSDIKCRKTPSQSVSLAFSFLFFALHCTRPRLLKGRWPSNACQCTMHVCKNIFGIKQRKQSCSIINNNLDGKPGKQCKWWASILKQILGNVFGSKMRRCGLTKVRGEAGGLTNVKPRLWAADELAFLLLGGNCHISL